LSTRQTKNTSLGRFAVPVLSILLTSYFAYHAWSGRYGIESMRRLEDESVRLEFELADIKLRRQAIEAKVMLLRDGSIERDMLDEQARNALNVLAADQLAIMR
jgi:cell division protein FtsB